MPGNMRVMRFNVTYSISHRGIDMKFTGRLLVRVEIIINAKRVYYAHLSEQEGEKLHTHLRNRYGAQRQSL